MTDTIFLVDAGGTRAKRGAGAGIAETQAYRITAPGPTAARDRGRAPQPDGQCDRVVAEAAAWAVSASGCSPRRRIASCTGGRPVYQ